MNHSHAAGKGSTLAAGPQTHGAGVCCESTPELQTTGVHSSLQLRATAARRGASGTGAAVARQAGDLRFAAAPTAGGLTAPARRLTWRIFASYLPTYGRCGSRRPPALGPRSRIRAVNNHQAVPPRLPRLAASLGAFHVVGFHSCARSLEQPARRAAAAHRTERPAGPPRRGSPAHRAALHPASSHERQASPGRQDGEELFRGLHDGRRLVSPWPRPGPHSAV